jgi:glycosyltransferase involved in cell wall biosynthesis
MNKIIEYMALGVPIVQFDLLEGRRSAEGSSLYALPDSPESLAEKLNWLLENEEARISMSQLGRSRFAEVLCWEKQEAKLLSVYENLIL